MPKMSNEDFIYHFFVKSSVSETLGRTLLFHLSDIRYNPSLESNVLSVRFLKNSLLILLGNIFKHISFLLYCIGQQLFCFITCAEYLSVLHFYQILCVSDMFKMLTVIVCFASLKYLILKALVRTSSLRLINLLYNVSFFILLHISWRSGRAFISST